MAKLLKKIQVACETGGKDLTKFANVAGMTGDDFTKAFEKDAVGALSAFIKGLNDTKRNGKSAIGILDDMELTEVRLSNTILALASSNDLMNNAIETANKAWEDNSALTEEASKRYNTLKSQIITAVNKLKDIAITIGEKLMPYVQSAIDGFGKWVDKFSELSDEQVDMIVKIGLVVAAIGPLITILGKVIYTVGGVTKGIGNCVQAFQVARGTVTSTSIAVNRLASGFTLLANPVALCTVAIVAAEAALISYHAKQIKEMAALNGVRDSLEDQTKKWNELKEAREDSIESSTNEIVITEKLADELSKIVDENGQIKQGYEARAKYITGELNSALGTEYSVNGNIISQYSTMKTKIEELIIAKRAEALLNAYQSEYAEALKGQSEATQNLVSLKQQQIEVIQKLQSASGRERAELQANLTQITTAIGEQGNLLSEYGYTIQNYENLQTASASNSAEAIDAAVEQMGISWEKAKSSCADSIESQVKTQAQYVGNLKEALNDAKEANDTYQANILQTQLDTEEKQLKNLAKSMGEQTSTVETLSKEQIIAWKELADNDITAFNEGLSKLSPTTQGEIMEATGIVKTNKTLQNEISAMTGRVTNLYDKHLEIEDKTEDKVVKVGALLRNDTTVPNAARQLGINIDNGFNQKVNGKLWGNDLVAELSGSMSSPEAKAKIEKATGGIAGWIRSIIGFSLPEKGPLSDADTYMPDMIDLLTQGVKKNKAKLVGAVEDMSEEMSEELQQEPTSSRTYTSRNARYNFTMNVYCQNLNESELDNIFNYINKRFGSEY